MARRKGDSTMLNKMRLRNSRYLALNWEEVSSVKYVCVCVCVGGGGGGGGGVGLGWSVNLFLFSR